MRAFISAVILTATMHATVHAQSLAEAQRDIDNENYFRAKNTLFKLLNDPLQKGDALYYLGNAYLKTDDVDSAKVFYKLAYNPDTKTPNSYLANGRLALLNKNLAEAKLNFDRAAQITRMKNALVFYEAGDAYFRPNVIDAKLAISNLEQAHQIDNKNTAIMLNLGDAYLSNSSNDNTMGGKAMNMYELASTTDPKNTLSWIKIGRLAVAGRIYDQAIESYNKALAIDPSYSVVYKELAEAYYYTKQYDKVTPMFQKYVELNPGDNEARTKIAGIYFRDKAYDKAIDEATKGLQNDPGNYIFARILAFANYELKRYKDAADAMKKFWELPTKKAKDIDYVYSARIAAATGDTAQAISNFKSVLERDSNNCDLLGEYGKVLFQAKRYTDAIAQYKLKQERCNKLGSIELFYLGRSYYASGDSIMADTSFAEFIIRNPTSPDGYYWRANVNLKLGKPEEFRSFPYYQKYIELTASEPQKYKRNLVDAYDYLGAYYFERDKALAKENLNKALELDPNDKFALEFLKALN